MRSLLQKLFVLLFSCNPVISAHADYSRADGDVELEQLSLPAVFSEQYVALVGPNNPQLKVYSGHDEKPIAKIDLNPQFDYLDIEPINQNGTTTGVAILGERRSSGGTRVWIWEPGNTTLSGSLNFGSSIDAIDLEVLDTQAGLPEILILARRRDNPDIRLLLKKSLSEGATTISSTLTSQIDYHDLEIINNLEQQLALFGVLTESQAARVEIYAASTLLLASHVGFGVHEYVDFKVIETSSNAHAIALLGRIAEESGTRIDVKDLDGIRLSALKLPSFGSPVKLVSASTEAWELTDTPSIGFINVHQSSLESSLVVLNPITGEIFTKISGGAGSRSTDALHISNSNDHTETSSFVLVQQHVLTNTPHLKLRSISDERVITIPIRNKQPNRDWYANQKVIGHTRMFLVHPEYGINESMFGTSSYKNTARNMSKLGANIFVRHIKSADEDPIWPSKAPLELEYFYSEARSNEGIPIDAEQNLVQPMVNESFENNTIMIGYYAESGEQRIAEMFPEWICKNFDGTDISHATKGKYLDITGAYGDIVETRLLELADTGLAGIYMDFRHMPPNGCWGSALANRYLQETGFVAPPVTSSIEYLRYSKFYVDAVADQIDSWKTAVEEQYPYVQLVVSTTSVPALTRSDMSSRLASIASSKSEFSITLGAGQTRNVFEDNPNLHTPADQVRIAIGLLLLRDTALNNQQPQIWSASTPNGSHLNSFITAVIAHGAAASINVIEAALQPSGNAIGFASREELQEGFELGNSLSEIMLDTEPLRWAGVYFSEEYRNSFLRDSRAAWSSGLVQTVGAFEAMLRLGVPISIFTDDNLSTGISDGIEVLHIPHYSRLSGSYKDVIDQFKNNGGRVLGRRPDADWIATAGYQTQLDRLSQLILNNDPPVQISNLHPDVHAIPYLKHNEDGSTSLLLAITNNFAFVQSSVSSDPIPSNEVNPMPPQAPAGASIILSNQFVQALWPNSGATVALDALSNETFVLSTDQTATSVDLPAFQTSLFVLISGE